MNTRQEKLRGVQAIPFEALKVGQSVEIERICTANDLVVFAHASGSRNPVNLPWTDYTGDGQEDAPVAPSMWLGSLISSVLGNHLPGPGTLYLSQQLDFRGRACVGDRLVVRVEVTALHANRQVALRTGVNKVSGEVLAEGQAQVVAPENPVYLGDIDVPELQIQRHSNFEALLETAKPLKPMPVAVVAPDDPNSLGGALLASDEGLIRPVLIGSSDRIEKAAESLGRQIAEFEFIDIENESLAAARAV
ncbi:MAG: enoyl-CoA hydratase, partial [Pseudomonadota bacterium]